MDASSASAKANAVWIGDPPPTNDPWETTGGPWPYTAPNTAPWPEIPKQQPMIPFPNTSDTVFIPPVPDDMPDSEEFHDFMSWLCGFTDPETPPSQERWEAFQQRVREMAALFFEYKKAMREYKHKHGGPVYSVSCDMADGPDYTAIAESLMNTA